MAIVVAKLDDEQAVVEEGKIGGSQFSPVKSAIVRAEFEPTERQQ